MLKINYMSMQKINNVCSFCNSKIPQGQSICKNCIKLYGITIGNYENDGCGCNKWNVFTNLFIKGQKFGIINH